MKKKLDCIMLIDDSDEDNFYHQLVLKEADITNHIQVAESGFEALNFLTEENRVPELIFLDINMPAMNGWDFMEEYKKLSVKQKAQITIIMLTTSLHPEDKKKSEKIPEINGFETKPLTHEKLINILKLHFLHNKNEPS